jgi:hypothetical protein
VRGEGYAFVSRQPVAGASDGVDDGAARPERPGTTP